jgi:hypothetical protein
MKKLKNYYMLETITIIINNQENGLFHLHFVVDTDPIVGVDCNVSLILLMKKKKRSKKLYLRSPTLLREVNGGGA